MTGPVAAEAVFVAYADEHGKLQRPWQTSWGASTRLLGAAIMVHGDDHGLRLRRVLRPSKWSCSWHARARS